MVKVLFNLVIIDNNYIEVKVKNVREYMIINNVLQIFTYYDKFKSVIYLTQRDCIQVYQPLQHNKRKVIF